MGGADAYARAAFLRACALDVGVRKAGNVSAASAGHRMEARQFLQSAEAAAAALFQHGTPVGARIEAAMHATWAAVQCNTNLGIVLLCAPVARAAETLAPGESLARAVNRVLAQLDRDDARAAYRAIAMTQPGGLGRAEAEDVHAEPQVDLREAMRLAAHRDRIAAQYAGGYADLQCLGLPACAGIDLSRDDAQTRRAVLRVYLRFLAAVPDSHIVRKHGEAVAQSVLHEAQPWQARADAGALDDDDEGWIAWDETLKRRGLNPGTSADLTVATLFWQPLAALAAQG